MSELSTEDLVKASYFKDPIDWTAEEIEALYSMTTEPHDTVGIVNGTWHRMCQDPRTKRWLLVPAVNKWHAMMMIINAENEPPF